MPGIPSVGRRQAAGARCPAAAEGAVAGVDAGCEVVMGGEPLQQFGEGPAVVLIERSEQLMANGSVSNTSVSARTVRPTQAGPPSWLLAGVSTGLLLGVLGLSAALGGVPPSPFAEPAVIREYFLGSPAAVRAAR